MNSSSTSYFVNLAQATDIDAITALLQANSPSQGGSLTGEFSRDKVASMADGASPVIVARRVAGGPAVGVLFSAEKATAQAPVVLAMLAAYAGSDKAYVYGPVRIADPERGAGLAGAVVLCHARAARGCGGGAVHPARQYRLAARA